MRVLPFSCNTPYQIQVVRCKSLAHFDEVTARQSTDRRTIDFAFA